MPLPAQNPSSPIIPGPYRVFDTHPDHVCLYIGTLDDEGDGMHKEVATVYLYGSDGDQARRAASATLFAASPDLLLALVLCARRLEEICEEHGIEPTFAAAHAREVMRRMGIADPAPATSEPLPEKSTPLAVVEQEELDYLALTGDVTEGL